MKQWAVFELSGQLICRPIERTSSKSVTVTDAGKIPRSRVWLIGDYDYTQLLNQSAQMAANLEIEKVWQAAAGKRILPQELAIRVGLQNASEAQNNINAVDTVGTLAVLQTVLSNPAYFRRNSGMLCPAHADDLEKARIALKKRQVDREQENQLLAKLNACLTARQNGNAISPPQQIIENRSALLAGADKSTILYRAVRKAAGSERNIAQFLIDIGVFDSHREVLRAIFMREWAVHANDSAQLSLPIDSMPLADIPTAGAFSIDDIGTFEIDDAFSVSPHPRGMRVGVHIAVPALAHNLFANGMVNNPRLISVYFPDEKVPMLSEEHIDLFSLCANKTSADKSCPALSLYSIFDCTNGEVIETQTKLERVQIGANYTLDDFDESDSKSIIKHSEQYHLLKTFAEHLPPLPDGWRHEFRIIAESPPRVLSRPRGAVSLMVERLMRYTNQHWGSRLCEVGGGLFRNEGMLTISPQSDSYAWTTSPLRRAVDLANQRLLLTAFGFLPKIKYEWRQLLRNFSSQQNKARRYQDMVERYWVLQALSALPPDTILHSKRREKNRVRLRDYPISAPVVVQSKKMLPPTDSEMMVRIHKVDFAIGRVLLVPA